MTGSNSCLSPDEKIPRPADSGITKGDFPFLIETGLLCVLITIASMRLF